MGGLVVLRSGQGLLVVRLHKVSEGGIYCVILLYSVFCFIVCCLLSVVLFYSKCDVC